MADITNITLVSDECGTQLTLATLDEVFADYLDGAAEAIQTDIQQTAQDDTERCERLKQIKDNVKQLSKESKRKKAVKSVIDKLGDKADRDDFAYYSEGLQMLLDMITAERPPDTPLLPSVRTYSPPKLNIPSAKVVSRIFSNDERTRELMYKGKGTTDICSTVRGKPCKRQIHDIKCVQLLDNKELLSNLTAFDRNVFNAVCTLYENASESGQTEVILTAKQVYKILTGRETKHPETLDKIAAAVEKLSSYRIEFNWVEHAWLNGLDKDLQGVKNINDVPEKVKKRYIIKDNLLHTQSASYVANGKTVEHAYKLLTEPLLYRYARTVKQIVTINRNILQIPKLSNTDDIVMMKNYLAYRIELMRNKKNRVKSDKILFDSVFDECQIEFKSNAKIERKRKRETIRKILDYWGETGYITRYDVIKESGKYTGVQIIL